MLPSVTSRPPSQSFTEENSLVWFLGWTWVFSPSSSKSSHTELSSLMKYGTGRQIKVGTRRREQGLGFKMKEPETAAHENTLLSFFQH